MDCIADADAGARLGGSDEGSWLQPCRLSIVESWATGCLIGRQVIDCRIMGYKLPIGRQINDRYLDKIHFFSFTILFRCRQTNHCLRELQESLRNSGAGGDLIGHGMYASFVGYVLSADLILTGSDQRATETQLLTIGVVVSSVCISI
jgi:hypothetical protein